MIVAADAGDNPLADRREDRKAAAERERKAKVAKVASQATNAMAAVRAQLDLREKGAADKAANKANEDAGAPVRASSTMLERVFAARLDGPDKYVVAQRKERKTAAGAGTAADLARQYQTNLTLTPLSGNVRRTTARFVFFSVCILGCGDSEPGLVWVGRRGARVCACAPCTDA